MRKFNILFVLNRSQGPQGLWEGTGPKEIGEEL